MVAILHDKEVVTYLNVDPINPQSLYYMGKDSHQLKNEGYTLLDNYSVENLPRRENNGLFAELLYHEENKTLSYRYAPYTNNFVDENARIAALEEVVDALTLELLLLGGNA